MNEKTAELCRFFEGKAQSLQDMIDFEIDKIGGETMLISRIDLMYWVYDSRKLMEKYHAVCRVLSGEAEEDEKKTILEELSRKAAWYHGAMEMLQWKLEEGRKTGESFLNQMRQESGYYDRALNLLEMQSL